MRKYINLLLFAATVLTLILAVSLTFKPKAKTTFFYIENAADRDITVF